MVYDFGLKFELQSDQLFIHFDVSEHHLKLETFIQTATHAQDVIKALDKELFDGKLKYDLIVVPPEEGSFLTRLAVYVWAAGASIIGFLETDIGKAFIEGLTDKEPAEWVKETTEKYADKIKNVTKEDEVALQEAVECGTIARVITRITKNVLEKESRELKRIGITEAHFPNLIEARNEFYEACIADREIKAIGFSDDNDFPIPRQSFPERAIKVTRKESEDDELPWEVSIESIFVTSPNWDQDDQSSRKWKGKDSIRRECYFIIIDQEFWGHVKLKDLHVAVLDVLKVQWAFQIIAGRPQNRRVLRVLEFNGEVLAEPLSHGALTAVLGDITTSRKVAGQRSLFEE